MLHRLRSNLVLMALSLTISSCGGGGGASNNNTNSATTEPTISGSVSAPGGAIAFNPPTGLHKFFADFFGTTAVADVPGSSQVGPGVTVNLIQIDTSGAQVGSPLASTTTDSNGAYTLTAPANFVPSPQYAIRAEGSSTSSINALVTGTTVSVDPSTQATETLILGSLSTNQQLTGLSSGSVTALQGEINQVILDTGLNGASGTVDAVASNIESAGNNSETVTNLANSLAQTGIITGQVTDTNGNAVAGVKILARDYNNWVTRAATITDANGNYTLNVPPNKDYIVGEINTTTNPVASAWWTSGCTTVCNAANQFKAARVSVGTSAATTNFMLPNGVVVTGKITDTSGSVGLAGIKVLLRDFTSDQPASGVYTDTNGNYRITMLPGSYSLAAVNQKMGSPYGGIYYSSTAGINSNQAKPLVLSTGTQTINLALPAGHMVSGQVTDPSSGTATPVTGIAIRVYSAAADATHGAFVQAVRTNLAGNYQVVLPNGQYAFVSRGQSLSPLDNSTSDLTDTNFTANVGVVTATILDTNSNPVGQAKVHVWKVDKTPGCNPSNSSAYCFVNIGHEVSNSDGTVTLYAPDSSGFSSSQSYVLEVVLDSAQQTLGSVVYDSANNTTNTTTTTNLAAGTPVSFTAGTTAAFGNIYLPAGGELRGTVSDTSNSPYANALIQVRSSTGGNSRIVNTRTMADGTYSISLPAGTYNVCAMTTSSTGTISCGSGTSAGSYEFQTGQGINANSVNTLDFQY